MNFNSKTLYKISTALLALLIFNLAAWTIEIVILTHTNGLPIDAWKQSLLGVLVIVGLPFYLVLIYKVNRLRKKIKQAL